MSEAKLRKKVSEAFAGTGTHLSWIESHHTSAGFPDLELCHQSLSQQIELKYADESGEVKIRKTQYLWFRNRVKAGGFPLLWVMDYREVHYLLPGSLVYAPSPVKNLADILARPHLSFGSAKETAESVLRINRSAIIGAIK